MSDGVEVAVIAGWIGLLATALSLIGSWYAAGGRPSRERRAINEELDLVDRLEGHKHRERLQRLVEQRIADYVGYHPASEVTQLGEYVVAKRPPPMSSTAKIGVGVGPAIAVLGGGIGALLTPNASTEHPAIHDVPTGLLGLAVVISVVLFYLGVAFGLRALWRRHRRGPTEQDDSA